MDNQKTCMFIMSTLIYAMQGEDGEFKNGHLDLISKREGVEGLAELADRLTKIAVKQITEFVHANEYDICKATLDGYLTGVFARGQL